MKNIKLIFTLLLTITLNSCGLIDELTSPYDIGNFIDQYQKVKFKVETTYPNNKIKTLVFEKHGVVYVNDTLGICSYSSGSDFYVSHFNIKSVVQNTYFVGFVEKNSSTEFILTSDDRKYIFKLTKF